MSILSRWLYAIFALLGLANLAACDAYKLQQLQPGVSTAAEVRQQFGEPEMRWRNADGSQTWEFSRQPAGTECFMVTLDSDDILRSIEQVLTDANFARIQPGMNADEVRRILGKPARSTPLQLKGEIVQEWRIGAGIGSSGDDEFFTVNFNQDGRVSTSGRHIQYRR